MISAVILIVVVAIVNAIACYFIDRELRVRNRSGTFVIVDGNEIRGLDMTGPEGEDWTTGDKLYLSPTIPGAMTNIKPPGQDPIGKVGRDDD